MGGSINSVCVFCGAAEGINPAHAEAACALGQAMAERGLGLFTVRAMSA